MHPLKDIRGCFSVVPPCSWFPRGGRLGEVIRVGDLDGRRRYSGQLSIRPHSPSQDHAVCWTELCTRTSGGDIKKAARGLALPIVALSTLVSHLIHLRVQGPTSNCQLRTILAYKKPLTINSLRVHILTPLCKHSLDGHRTACLHYRSYRILWTLK